MVRRAQTAIYLEGETERQSGKKRERAREKGRNIEKHEIGREGLGERLSGKQREERERKS